MSLVKFLSSMLLVMDITPFLMPMENIPTGWRMPSDPDMVGNWEEYKNDIPRPFHVVADFDGDAMQDEARILISTDGLKWGLFFRLGGHDWQKLEISSVSEIPPQTMGIELAETGLYEGLCSKIYFECDAENEETEETLVLRNPGIHYFAYESASSIFYWQDKSKSFKQIWLSD